MKNKRTSQGISETMSSTDWPQYFEDARKGDYAAFGQLTEPHRLELLAHCYRMLGSIEDAEDIVQETFLRAWRRLETYEGRASFRAWLYKIATNACLDALRARPKRGLPALSIDSEITGEPLWLEPYPEAWWVPTSSGPEARYDEYESISLAFMVMLQVLPPRQRAVLILKDVLDWPMADISNVLGISLSAATSLMHRARMALKQQHQSGKVDLHQLGIPGNEARELLDQYARAWESADLEGIVALLTEDVTFPMPPVPVCIQGKTAVRKLLSETLFSGNAVGRWKLLFIRANGEPGFAFYRLDETTQKYLPFALQILTIVNDRIMDATTFGFPALFETFKLPPVLQ